MTGLVVVVGVAATWVAGFWSGWALILFAGDGFSMTLTGREPEVADAFSHAGQALNTLGGALTQPMRGGWSLVNVLIGLQGMMSLTLAVSFILTMRQTVEAGRAFAALVRTGPREVEPMIERLADLVAGLQTAPFALFYGNWRDDRHLPDALVDYARQAEDGAPAHVRAQVFEIMSDLPRWEEARGNGLAARAEDWARRYRLSPDRLPG
jgi:hypothetical protein